MRYRSETRCLRTSTVGDRLPVRVDEIARQLGIHLEYCSLSPAISGHLWLDFSGWVAIINSTMSPGRQRFSIAHELAHYVLHREAVLAGTVTRRQEVEADQFAADLLMPSDHLRRLCHALPFDTMSQILNVSRAALQYRLQALGLFPADWQPCDLIGF